MKASRQWLVLSVALLATLGCTKPPAKEARSPKPPTGSGVRDLGFGLEIVGGTAMVVGATTMTGAAVASGDNKDTVAIGAATAVAGGALFALGYWLTLEGDRLYDRYRTFENRAGRFTPVCKERLERAISKASEDLSACRTACNGKAIEELETSAVLADLEATKLRNAAVATPTDAAAKDRAEKATGTLVEAQAALAACQQQTACIAYEANLRTLQASAWCGR